MFSLSSGCGNVCFMSECASVCLRVRLAAFFILKAPYRREGIKEYLRYLDLPATCKSVFDPGQKLTCCVSSLWCSSRCGCKLWQRPTQAVKALFREKSGQKLTCLFILLWEKEEKEVEGWTSYNHHPESSRTRELWKPGFVLMRRNSEGNISLTWMFLSLISEQKAPQRAACLSLTKHNATQPSSPSYSLCPCWWMELLYLEADGALTAHSVALWKCPVL